MKHKFCKQPTFWQSKNLASVLLLPLSYIYQLIIFLRRLCYKYRLCQTTKLPVPIIIVGNITVGGVGKTPLVIWLVNFLRENGFTPGVISRGYGGSKNDTPFIVSKNSSVIDVGDEALMIVKQTDVPMVIAKNRVAAARELLANFNCNIIVSDDGLQHYALARDIEIIVIDGERKFGNAYCLPAGPLREPIKRLETSDFIITNTKIAAQNSMQLIPENIHNVKNPAIQKNISDFLGKQIHAFAGIGNPERFFNSLKQLGLSICEHAFPDHYPYEAKDLAFAADEIVLMTEKDAVKCTSFARNNWWYLQVNAKLDDYFIDNLKRKLQTLKP